MMSFALYCMLFVILVFCPETDSARLSWDYPPPTQVVQANSNPVKHLSSRQLFEGTINATLSWQFALTDLIFKSLLIFLEGNSVTVARVSSSVTGTSPSYANRFGLGWIPNQNLVKLFIFNVTTEDNGTFSCRVTADSLDRFSEFQFRSNVQVDVVAPPSNMITSSNQTVTAPAELTLNCSADGKPKPTITWRRVSDNIVVTMPLNITGEKEKGRYRCTANNSIGGALIKDVFVDVHVRPMVTLSSKVFVGHEQTASLICEVEGNPTPTISWSPCPGQSVVCDEQYLNISKVQTARANYTCTANNSVGVDSATTLLIIGGKNVYLRLNMTVECDIKDSVWEILQKELVKVFNNTQKYSGADLLDVRCGSLIFDVVLKFGLEVAEDETISTIQSAIVDGELSVNVSSVIGIPPVERSTTAAPSSSTAKPDDTKSAPAITEPASAEPKDTKSAPAITEPASAEPKGITSASSTTEPTSAVREDSPPTLWIIIGCAAGVVVVLAICVFTWWVHNKRKCRNDTKSKDQTLLPSRRLHEGRQQSCLCWLTYKRVISNL